MLQAVHRVEQYGPHSGRGRVGQVGDQRLGRRLAGQPEQGHQHQDPGEDRLDAVVGQRRRPVLQEVVLELRQGPAGRGPPPPAAQVGRFARQFCLVWNIGAVRAARPGPGRLGGVAHCR